MTILESSMHKILRRPATHLGKLLLRESVDLLGGAANGRRANGFEPAKAEHKAACWRPV